MIERTTEFSLTARRRRLAGLAHQRVSGWAAAGCNGEGERRKRSRDGPRAHVAFPVLPGAA